MFILQEFFGEKFSLLREFFRIQGNIYLVLSYHVGSHYIAKTLDTFDNIFVKQSNICTSKIESDLPSISKSGNENDGPLSKLVNPVTA